MLHAPRVCLRPSCIVDLILAGISIWPHGLRVVYLSGFDSDLVSGSWSKRVRCWDTFAKSTQAGSLCFSVRRGTYSETTAPPARAAQDKERGAKAGSLGERVAWSISAREAGQPSASPVCQAMRCGFSWLRVPARATACSMQKIISRAWRSRLCRGAPAKLL